MIEFEPHFENLSVVKFGGNPMLHMDELAERQAEDPSRKVAVVSALGSNPDHPVHDKRVTKELHRFGSNRDEGIVDELIEKLELQVDAETTPFDQIRDKFPRRWLDASPRAVAGPYTKQAPAYFWFLWIDSENQTAYYHEFST